MYAGMGHKSSSIALLALFISYLVGVVQGLEFSSINERRRRLLEQQTGGRKGPMAQVQTQLAHQLAGPTGTSPPAVENVQDQDAPALRGLRLAFYDDLDPSRSEAERDYVMNKLMPATGAVLARSMRVSQPSGLLPLSRYPDEAGNPIPGDPEGVLLRCYVIVVALKAASEVKRSRRHCSLASLPAALFASLSHSCLA